MIWVGGKDVDDCLWEGWGYWAFRADLPTGETAVLVVNCRTNGDGRERPNRWNLRVDPSGTAAQSKIDGDWLWGRKVNERRPKRGVCKTLKDAKRQAEAWLGSPEGKEWIGQDKPMPARIDHKETREAAMEGNEQQYQMYLVLGDWSEDGHCFYTKVLVKANRSHEEIQEAYKASCKRTSLSFDINETFVESGDYLEERKFQICTEYQSGLTLSPEARAILEKEGVDLSSVDDSDDELKDFADLWLQFVRLSLPGLEWEFPKDNTPCINGFWSKTLNTTFGYGLFG